MIINEICFQAIAGSMDQLIDQIYETKFLDRDELRDKLFLFIRIMISDIRKSQITELEEKRMELAKRIGVSVLEGNEMEKLKARLSWMDKEIKFINKTYYSFKQYNEYEMLKKFIRRKFGDTALLDFYNQTRSLEQKENHE